MAAEITAVIAALSAALEQQEQYEGDDYVSVDIVNRWVRVAPLEKDVRDNLMLGGDFQNEVYNHQLIGHISAVLSFLEVLEGSGDNSTPQATNARIVEAEILPPEQLSLTKKKLKKFW